MEQEPFDDLRRLVEELTTFERELGLPEGFSSGGLWSEPSDWAFIIKAAALLEAAVLHVLSEQVPQLEAVLKNGLSRSARLKCLKHLRILDDRAVCFIRAVNELRDHYAHHISSANATILEILDEKPANERLGRMRHLAYFTDVEHFRQDPRAYIGLSVLFVLKSFADHVRLSREMVSSLVRSLMKPADSPEA